MDVSRKGWTLWTIWSAELGKLINQSDISSKDFTELLLNAVKDKDRNFDYDPKESIYAIQPTPVFETKLSADGSKKIVEIGGTIFKPGSRRTDGGAWGQRWRMLVENSLVRLFDADHNFKWVHLKEEVFIIIGGRVLEAANRIWMDDPNYKTKIIRLINQEIKPGGDKRYTSVSYDYLITWVHPGPREHTLQRIVPFEDLVEVVPNGQTTHESQPIQNLVLNGTSPQKTPTKSSRKRRISEESSTLRPKDIADNNSHDDEVEELQSCSPQPRRSTPPKIDKRRGNNRQSKTYEKLKDLYLELSRMNCHNDLDRILKRRNVYGVVDYIIDVPTEDEKKGLPSKSEKAARYLLRISDDTMKQVLVRLCTVVTAKERNTAPSKVGPPMVPGDILRIHRATVQFENLKSGPEMVISTAPHLNYTVFRKSDDVDAEIEYERLASKTPALRENDYPIIKMLRKFYLENRPNGNGNGSSEHSPRDDAENCEIAPSQKSGETFAGTHWDLEDEEVLFAEGVSQVSSQEMHRSPRLKLNAKIRKDLDDSNESEKADEDQGGNVPHEFADSQSRRSPLHNSLTTQIFPLDDHSSLNNEVNDVEMEEPGDEPGGDTGSNHSPAPLMSQNVETEVSLNKRTNKTTSQQSHGDDDEVEDDENKENSCNEDYNNARLEAFEEEDEPEDDEAEQIRVVPIKSITLHDCEQSVPMNLYGKIIDMLYLHAEDKILVRVTDSTIPTVWLTNLIEDSDNPIKTAQPFFDMEITGVNNVPEVRNKIIGEAGMGLKVNWECDEESGSEKEVGEDVLIFKNVLAVPCGSAGSCEGFKLLANAETVF